MEKRKAQVPLVCHGHSRPIVDLSYSSITPDGFFLVNASKDGKPMLRNGETGDWIETFDGHKGSWSKASTLLWSRLSSSWYNHKYDSSRIALVVLERYSTTQELIINLDS